MLRNQSNNYKALIIINGLLLNLLLLILLIIINTLKSRVLRDSLSAYQAV
jgi:uncharacterized integral membrane protein